MPKAINKRIIVKKKKKINKKIKIQTICPINWSGKRFKHNVGGLWDTSSEIIYYGSVWSVFGESQIFFEMFVLSYGHFFIIYCLKGIILFL